MGTALEELIGRALETQEQIRENLASYLGEPAVFQLKAPQDHDPGWDTVQFPRMDYTLDLQANPERKTCGLLAVNVWYEESEPYQAQILEPAARDALDGVFLRPDGDCLYSLAWIRTDAFEVRDAQESTKQICGLSLQFDVYAFPCQDEDGPAGCLNRWTQDNLADLKIITASRLPDPIWKPRGEETAIYWRVLELAPDANMARYSTWSVTWMQGVLQGHVFTQFRHTLYALLRRLSEQLVPYAQIPMPDGSPFLIRRLQANSAWDALRQGQIALTGSYGIMRTPPKNAIQSISVKEKT